MHALDVELPPNNLHVHDQAAGLSELESTLSRLRQAQRTAPRSDHRDRCMQLERLREELRTRRDEVVRTVERDFGRRSRHESLMAEVLVTLRSIDHIRSNLRTWMKPKRRRVSWMFPLGKAWVIHQPLGVVGILSPWNYPVHLALAPLAAALAAGNRVMLKPSDNAPFTSELVADLVETALGRDQVSVVNGGSEVSAAFSRLPFDHLFFTGSPQVGRAVMRACADNLTSVTLELGGKAPAIVGRSFPVSRAATRIMTGKLFNAGQTCLAPDYALVPAEQAEEFASACGDAGRAMYPSPSSADDYTSIINQHHYQRLLSCVRDAAQRGARVMHPCGAGDSKSAAQRKFMPTLLLDVRPDMRVMQDEIFGPILPILTYQRVEDALAFTRQLPHPLALYYFGHDRSEVELVLEQSCSGGVTINDTCLHAAQEDLPFGGVGGSGFGRYHGFEGFAAFSNQRAVFRQGPIDTGAFVRAPFGPALDKTIQLMLR